MAKTLIIKGADFSANKLDKVTFLDIPCVGLSFTKTSDSASIGEEYNVSYTVSPSNTTDRISWSTSDSSVASVSNGVVIPKKTGNVTITATCGAYSASIRLEVSAFAKFDYHVGFYMSSNNRDSADLNQSANRTAYGKTGDGLHALWMDAVTKEIGLTFIPYPIPSTASKLNITTNGKTSYLIFTDNTTVCAAGNNGCKAVAKDDGWISGNRQVAIPEGANSFYISITSTNPSDLSVEFL